MYNIHSYTEDCRKWIDDDFHKKQVIDLISHFPKYSFKYSTTYIYFDGVMTSAIFKCTLFRFLSNVSFLIKKIPECSGAIYVHDLPG